MKMGTRRGNSLGRLVAPVVIGAVLAVSFTGSAAAQPATQNQAPAILRPPSSGGKTDEPPKYRMYLTVIVIGGLMLGANAIPSKRGHQD